MTSEQLAQQVVENAINNGNHRIVGLLLEQRFDMKDENGKITLSATFEHLEVDEMSDLIRNKLKNQIENVAKSNPKFEKQIKKYIKKTISNPAHLYNDYVNRVNELFITNISVDVTEKQDVWDYHDSAKVWFYVDMETL